MKLIEKVWGSLGLLEPVEESLNEKSTDADDNKVKKSSSNANNVVNLHSQKQMKVMIVEPMSFDDAQHVADFLKNRKPVVVNFENTDKDVAKRMIDFISGTTYALGGTIQKIGNNIFLCAPSNVDVSYSPQEDAVTKNILPWKK